MPLSRAESRVLSVKFHLRDEQTNGWTDKKTRLCPSILPFFRSSLCPLCLSEASFLWGRERTAIHRNLRRGDKNPESTNKCTKFGQLIVRKIIKIIATMQMSHFEAKMHQIHSWHLYVRPFVLSFVSNSMLVTCWRGSVRLLDDWLPPNI